MHQLMTPIGAVLGSFTWYIAQLWNGELHLYLSQNVPSLTASLADDGSRRHCFFHCDPYQKGIQRDSNMQLSTTIATIISSSKLSRGRRKRSFETNQVIEE